MKLSIKPGSTSVTLEIFIQDSTSTTGAGKTGLVFNTASLVAYYARPRAAAVAITLATQTVTGAFSSGGFVEIDATNMPGLYRLDIPDAAIASGVRSVIVMLKGATGMAPLPLEIDLNSEVNVTHFDGTAGTFASGIPAASLTTAAINSVADQVHDEAMSGHVISGSFGASAQPTDQGTAQAGGASSITLRSGASASDDYYNKQVLKIVAGTGAGQSEYISDYVGSTRVATMGAAWITVPDATSVYVVDGGGTIPGASAPTADQNAAAVWNKLLADHVASGSFGQVFSHFVKRRATAQAGGASTITLDASASATNEFYRYDSISIIGGTGAGQGSRQISGYVGSSKVATVNLAWTVQPDNTSIFLIAPLGIDAATVASIADAVWDEARGGHVTAGTFGEYSNASVIRINGDATAAANAGAAFNTGYTFTGCVMPSVTTVTGNVNGNVSGNVTGSVGSMVGNTAQTGDAFARLGAPAGASVSADMAAVKAETAAIVADTNELQVDWVNGGRLDLLLDGVKAKTDGLTFTVANIVDANIERINAQDIGAAKPYNTAT